ncbi:unnamed protein product [Mortierella alpina]
MGSTAWDELARLICLCASFVLVVGGILGTFEPLPAFDELKKLPGLYEEPVPLLPASLICLGLIVLAMEYPLVHRPYFLSSSSHMPKVLFYIPLTIAALLEAQTVNGGLYLAIGTMAYLKAVRKESLQTQQAKTITV